jgi:putative membrane protein
VTRATHAPGVARARTARASATTTAAIVVAANDADVANGNEARGRTKNPEVRQFAEMMVADHTSSNKQAKDLASQLNLTPEDNATSDDIRKSQDAVRDSLKKLAGGQFDKAYVDNEVAYHQSVLDAIDGKLVPNARNPQLKKLLEDTRPVVAHHLEEAKKLQIRLGSRAGAGGKS